MKREGLYEYVNRITADERDWSTVTQKELASRIIAASVYLNEISHQPVANWVINSSGNLGIGTKSPSTSLGIVGSTDKGPKNKPVFIDTHNKFYEMFGEPGRIIRKVKRIFNENDPYGEENWEE